MKRRDKIILAAVIVAMIAFYAVIGSLPHKTISQPTVTALVVIVTAAAVAYFIFLLCKMSSAKKNRKRRHLDRYGATMSGTLKHLDGLPLAKNLPVEMLYCPDKVVFRKDAQEIVIAMEKITGMDVVTGQNAGRQIMSGAATGKYVMGGSTGAAVGALAAVKTQLVVSYTSGGKNKSVVLDTAQSGTFATKAVKEFRKTHASQRTTIEL